MFCPECGAPNEEDAVYCGNCGAPVNPDSMPATEGDETPPPASSQEVDADRFEKAEELEKEESPPREPSDMVLAPPGPPPPPPPPVYRSTAMQTSGLAIASAVMGIAGWTVFPILGSILAIILGYAARREIRQRSDQLTGEGLAVAGLVLGWLVVGLTVVGLCVGAFALCFAVEFFGAAGGY